ncbi:rRNA maturation RNase YbeY [Methylotetracoccus oryzae]|uniref:rRNA maturation RNase YbeY n=1 Tax=Methylotetracoccus oryzae TaxID=1919059 RepID=UPI001119E783|nr:rRNA maturation RNase YbeY [Methylotetracoccus oryzae]
MLELELQLATDCESVPSREDFQRWSEQAVAQADAELVIRVVDRDESADLNSRYRGKAGATNVLSFPFTVPAGVVTELLGDLVLCAPLVEEEAAAQGKTMEAHWAHLTIHGVLHLQGYDHQSPDEAEIMEAKEVAILAQLGYPNPYEELAGA